MTLPIANQPGTSRRDLLKWIGGTGFGLILSGCSQDAAPDATPPALAVTSQPSATESADTGPSVASTTLRVALVAAPRQFDPARMTQIEEFHLAYALYDALVYVDDELNLQPLLAESWQANPTFTEWTFSLRPGVTFHNGAPMTADDVVYTFRHLAEIGNGDPELGASLQAVRYMQEVEALDTYSVRFYLSAPDADFPIVLASPQAGIIPNQISAADLATMPVGTGPFRFVENIPDDRMRLARNPEYWEADAITVQELEFVYIASFEAQTDALKRNQIHIVPDVNLENLAMLSADPDLQIHSTISGRYQSIVMQATESPFTDLRVRQAIKLCVDRTELQQQVLQTRWATGSDHPVASISPFWADLPSPARDIAQARRLLADAGYPNGLTLSLITSAARPGMVELAQALRDMAGPAGVAIDVIQVPADVYWTEYAGRVPFYIDDWNFRPSIDETFTVPFHSQSPQNGSKWQNPDFDALIDAARGEDNAERRQALYAEAQRLLMEEGGVIIPYFGSVLMASRSNVQDLTCNPTGFLDFFGVALL